MRKISRLGYEARLGWTLVAPALSVIALIAIFPLGWTVWESLHLHELRMPWLGQPFIGLANYVEIANDPRFWAALGHTAFFTVVSISLELLIGLFALLVDVHILREPMVWFIQTSTAWVPVILADVWKTTPFVALLLLAGLQNIDLSLYEAAAVDGANAWWQLRHITLPLLKPAILVTLIFRTLDGFRVFDLIYVLTGGGPGTSTEPVALYTFNALLQNLRFGYGSALSVVIFAITFGLALLYVRGLGVRLGGEET